MRLFIEAGHEGVQFDGFPSTARTAFILFNLDTVRSGQSTTFHLRMR
jgi:hypothetical protein